MLENIPDKKINRYVVGGAILVVLLFTAIRLIPFFTADDYKRATQFIGTPLPRSATEIKYSDKGSFHGGDYFVAARMSRPDFLEMITKLGMSNRVDLLTIWPNALESELPWWKPTPINDTNTFFAERPREFSRVVARYESNVMFFKRDVPKR